jgi:ribose transport system substrate-binding protein
MVRLTGRVFNWPHQEHPQEEDTMPHEHDEDGVSRRRACIIWAGTGVLWVVSGGISKSLSLLGPAEAAPAIAQTKPTIPIIVKDTTSFYWQTVLAGARKAGRDLGANVPELGAQSESDIDGQISILENAVASNPAAVVIAPAEFAALGKPIDEAAKKIKIIGIDSAANSAALTSVLMTDNVQAGRIAADVLATAIQRSYADAEGDVALITASPGVPSLDQRAQGFKEQIAAKYGALDIVAHKVADGRAATGFKIMTDLIAAHPELRGVFASNLTMAQGAGQAVAESKTNKTGDTINLVGFDSDDKLVAFLRDATIAALLVQDPFRMGYDGVKTALAASKGEQVPTNVDTGTNLITKANMNSTRSQELLNPKIK